MLALLTLPAELILHIAGYQSPPTVLSLLRTNRTLYYLLTDALTDSVFNDLTYASRAIYHAAERGNRRMIRRLVNAGILYDIDFTLNAAVAGETLEVVNTLLDCGVPAHTQDDWGETPLIVAAISSRVDVVRLLAPREDVDVNSTDWRRTTALAHAVRDTNGGVEVVRALLDRKDTDVNMRDIDGRSALHHAVEFGARESVGILLARSDVKVNYVDYLKHGMTVLHRAVFVADETIVRSLLDDPRVDVNLGDRRQNTPLHLAARRGYEPVLRMLLDCPRVNVNALNAAGCTPLAFAVDGSTEEIIGMLISNSRVDVNLPDPNLQTPLCIAAKRARYSAVKLLLEREDLDVNYRCHYGMTPLAHAADEPFKERTPPEHYQKIIKLLGTDQRVDVNLADRHLETPLHKAVRARGPNLVKELLRQRGIAVNARDQDGYTPLCLATRMAEREEHKGIVQALRAAQRVDVNAQDNKGTALGGKGLAPDDSARGAGNLPMSLFGIRKSFSGGTDKKVDVPGKDMGGTDKGKFWKKWKNVLGLGWLRLPSVEDGIDGVPITRSIISDALASV